MIIPLFAVIRLPNEVSPTASSVLVVISPPLVILLVFKFLIVALILALRVLVAILL